MSYMAKEIEREKATRVDNLPVQPPANGGMPGFGTVLGRGVVVGTLGGLVCNFVLMALVGGFLLFTNLFSFEMNLGAIVSGALGALLFLLLGSIVAAPIGLAIGVVSATLMWLGLRILPRRDEATRRMVGMVCAGFVALCATLIAATLLVDPSRAGWDSTLTQPMMWAFIPESIVVTITGGWFANHYFKHSIT